MLTSIHNTVCIRMVILSHTALLFNIFLVTTLYGEGVTVDNWSEGLFSRWLINPDGYSYYVFIFQRGKFSSSECVTMLEKIKPGICFVITIIFWRVGWGGVNFVLFDFNSLIRMPGKATYSPPNCFLLGIILPVLYVTGSEKTRHIFIFAKICYVLIVLLYN